MKKRHRSKAAQAAAERDVELYVRLEFDDRIIVEEYLLRNAIERSIHTLFGEIGGQSIHVEIVSYKYGTATIRTKAKMVNQLRCALALFQINLMWKHFTFDAHSVHLSCHDEVTLNEFDRLLQSEWNRALAQGLFTFEFHNQVKQRLLDGELHYVVELNPSRYEKRRLPYAFEDVNTPFDRTKFNFNKIKEDEILFSLDDGQQSDQHLVIINNSPIRPYHVLLVPNRQLEQVQVLTVDSLLFGLRFVASSAHPFLYAGFNSLCGYASINHLHLHGIYMPFRLFLQTIRCSPFHSKSNCYLHDLLDAQAFAFEIKSSDELERTARSIHKVTNYLASSSIAHNLSIVKGDSFSEPNTPALRVFVWFRQPNIGAKSCERCNFACLEMSGYVFLRYEEVFEDLTELELRQRIDAIALPAEEREKIKQDVMHLLDQ